MKLPLDLECPVEGWTRHKIFEYVTVPLADGKSSTKIPVMVYAWKDLKGEFYLNGETARYLDTIKANKMGLIDCEACGLEDSCSRERFEQCVKAARAEKGLV
jgi:hypothetical protein